MYRRRLTLDHGAWLSCVYECALVVDAHRPFFTQLVLLKFSEDGRFLAMQGVSLKKSSLLVYRAGTLCSPASSQSLQA